MEGRVPALMNSSETTSPGTGWITTVSSKAMWLIRWVVLSWTINPESPGCPRFSLSKDRLIHSSCGCWNPKDESPWDHNSATEMTKVRRQISPLEAFYFYIKGAHCSEKPRGQWPLKTHTVQKSTNQSPQQVRSACAGALAMPGPVTTDHKLPSFNLSLPPQLASFYPQLLKIHPAAPDPHLSLKGRS